MRYQVSNMRYKHVISSETQRKLQKLSFSYGKLMLIMNFITDFGVKYSGISIK